MKRIEIIQHKLLEKIEEKGGLLASEAIALLPPEFRGSTESALKKLVEVGRIGRKKIPVSYWTYHPMTKEKIECVRQASYFFVREELERNS